jgi:hypothetical protein
MGFLKKMTPPEGGGFQNASQSAIKKPSKVVTKKKKRALAPTFDSCEKC